MSNKGQLLQDPFLNLLRKEHVPVSIYLVNGIKLQGHIESFDQYVVLLRNTVTQIEPDRLVEWTIGGIDQPRTERGAAVAVLHPQVRPVPVFQVVADRVVVGLDFPCPPDRAAGAGAHARRAGGRPAW